MCGDGGGRFPFSVAGISRKHDTRDNIALVLPPPATAAAEVNWLRTEIQAVIYAADSRAVSAIQTIATSI